MTDHLSPTPRPSGPKRLVRSQDDRWLSGVCGGVAQYAGGLVRIHGQRLG